VDWKPLVRKRERKQLKNGKAQQSRKRERGVMCYPELAKEGVQDGFHVRFDEPAGRADKMTQKTCALLFVSVITTELWV